jgi:hypothetical protein
MRGKQTNVKPKTLDIFFFPPLSLCLLDNENERQEKLCTTNEEEKRARWRHALTNSHADLPGERVV